MTLSPLPQAPRILVSALFFYREELAEAFVGRLHRQLRQAVEALDCPVHLCLTLNYPKPGAIWSQVLTPFAQEPDPRLTVSVEKPGYNAGFGVGHNRALGAQPADVIVVMNNDLVCTADDWLVTMIRAFAQPGVAVVGAAENASHLRADGCGIPVSGTDRELDFVDGSLLAIRGDAARRLGLFSADFRYFYFEDSDLCLRFRQAGLGIAAVPLPHEHQRSASSKAIPRYLIGRVLDENRDRFFRKWGSFLATRRMTGRVRLDLRGASAAQLMAALPTALALQREHPATELEVVHDPAADVSLLAATGFRLTTGEPTEAADRVAGWAGAAEPAELPAAQRLARVAGVEWDSGYTARVLRAAVRAGAPAGMAERGATRFAVVHFAARPVKFDGAVPEPAMWAPAVERLRALGFAVEGLADCVDDPALDWFRPQGRVFANGISALERARLLLDAALVLAPEGDVLLTAQLLGVRALGVFGALAAVGCVFAWETTGVFYPPSLSCIGCNRQLGTPGRNFCLRQDHACLAAAQGGALGATTEAFVLSGRSEVARAMAVEQGALLRPRRPSPELDLSCWPED